MISKAVKVVGVVLCTYGLTQILGIEPFCSAEMCSAVLL